MRVLGLMIAAMLLCGAVNAQDFTDLGVDRENGRCSQYVSTVSPYEVFALTLTFSRDTNSTLVNFTYVSVLSGTPKFVGTVSKSIADVEYQDVDADAVELTYYADGHNVTVSPLVSKYKVQHQDNGSVYLFETASVAFVGKPPITFGLLSRMIIYSDPIDVMWSGPGGTRVVTITPEMLDAFKAGFWLNCLSN